MDLFAVIRDMDARLKKKVEKLVEGLPIAVRDVGGSVHHDYNNLQTVLQDFNRHLGEIERAVKGSETR